MQNTNSSSKTTNLSKILNKKSLLQIITATVITSLIAYISIPKLSKIFKNELVTSINIRDTGKSGAGGIPIVNAFVCGVNIKQIQVQYVVYGEAANNPALQQSYISSGNSGVLKSDIDWLNPLSPVPCFFFQPTPDNSTSGNTPTFTPGILDAVTIIALAAPNVSINSSSSAYAFLGLYSKERPLEAITPFVATPSSVNTFSFSVMEIYGSDNPSSYFTINKQNVVQLNAFGTPNLFTKFIYSPETFLVTEYKEKQQYTYYDLVGAVGGLLTYAFAMWVFLFGRGKYKSWGIVQQYLWKSSPDAHLKKMETVRKYLAELKGTGSPWNDTTLNTGGRLSSYKTDGPDDDNTSVYYFSDPGTPKVISNSAGGRCSASQIVTSADSAFSERELMLIKQIEERIDQKLWFLEQTLSKHYLSGFRLRKYNKHKVNDDVLRPPSAPKTWAQFDGGNPRLNKSSGSRNVKPEYVATTEGAEGPSSNSAAVVRTTSNFQLGQVPLEKKHRSRSSNTGSSIIIIDEDQDNLRRTL